MRDRRADANRHPQSLELLPGRRRAARRERRQDPVHRLDEDDPGVGRVDRPEIALERVARDLAEGACEFDARRPATDEHEGHPLATPFRISFPFRGLERDEDAPSDLDGVLDGLEPLGVGGPVVVPEERVVCTGRHDQGVVGDRTAVRDLDLAAVDVDADCFAEDDRHVPLAGEDRAQGLRDLARGQGARGDLIQHRLEQVEVPAVEQGDRDLGVAPQVPGGVQAAEAAADDQDAVSSPGSWPVGQWRWGLWWAVGPSRWAVRHAAGVPSGPGLSPAAMARRGGATAGRPGPTGIGPPGRER